MPSRDDPDAESLLELLDSLETTLSTLRSELEPERERGRNASSDSRRRPPRPSRLPQPPRMRDVLRFTDEYTIPTLIAILEANVRLLRLAQAGIRAVDPERSVLGGGGERDGAASFGGELRRAAGDAGRLSADRLASSLSDLQQALEETDTPENPEARDLLTDARTLSREIERRLRESREQTDLSRFDRRRSGRAERDAGATPVRIEVTDGDEADGKEEDDEPDVDVDAELESIKEEMGRSEDRDDAAEGTDVPIGGDGEEPGGEDEGMRTDDEESAGGDSDSEDDRSPERYR